MLFSPLRVVLCGALGGGLIYGGVRAAGGGQISPQQAITSHFQDHSSHSADCTSTACDHYVSCGSLVSSLDCGHKCVNLDWYKLGMTEDEKSKHSTRTDKKYHDSLQACPSSPTDNDFYKHTDGSYFKCPNPKPAS
ncbi:hypothetical protein MHLP_02795 [Candidatus Mycoplasma haematolamae str. Purdue]|uniref:Uncharacterized protein n=1 Tax=Mycoplasma haematolamae (strain Purdue) TaxID=1212765 RepID=I7CJU2_MYCHA|nr:hypothetical protein [Candidatus Mycoplasma haematolamae]AFO52139.1 hypothetical protein MHLP_02795 [Candidatus Mycoplasma haematolamae str. Purdue]